MAYYLSGDIGGTKTLLQLCAANSHMPILKKSFSSTDHDGLEGMIQVLLHEAGVNEIAAACMAVAGPVNGRKVQLTNLPWAVDADALAERFRIEKVYLLNDFEAAGYGIEALAVDELHTVQKGEIQTAGVKLVVGAGTGLGVAWMTKDGAHYRVHSSEGGHMDFAPQSDMQDKLLKYLLRRHQHVSYERIVSGPGLVAIYEFLSNSGMAIPSAQMLAAMQEGDEAAVISHFAIQEHESIARMTLALFFEIYGAFVGNLALAALPRGGIYLAGGITAKLHRQFAQSKFVESYRAKGRFTALLDTFPIQAVLNENLGLMGANLIAQRS